MFAYLAIISIFSHVATGVLHFKLPFFYNPVYVLNAIYFLVIPSLQQLCSGRCGSYINITVTVPEPVTIPCGDLQLSNTSTADYCNATDRINEPLVVGATTLYNLTVTEISHFNNIIYCTDNQSKIFCYRLTVFCKKICIHVLHVHVCVIVVAKEWLRGHSKSLLLLL